MIPQSLLEEDQAGYTTVSIRYCLSLSPAIAPQAKEVATRRAPPTNPEISDETFEKPSATPTTIDSGYRKTEVIYPKNCPFEKGPIHLDGGTKSFGTHL